MEDYEKFEQMINSPELKAADADGASEFERLFQIVQELESGSLHATPMVEAKSQRLMLAEAKQVRQLSRERRISFIGSLYGWAVPAVLLLVVLGMTFGNSSQNPLDDPTAMEGGSAPGALITIVPEGSDEDVLNFEPLNVDDDISAEVLGTITATVTLTPTQALLTTPLADDLVAYPGPESTPEADGPLDASVPERPLPGMETKPSETAEP